MNAQNHKVISYKQANTIFENASSFYYENLETNENMNLDDVNITEYDGMYTLHGNRQEIDHDEILCDAINFPEEGIAFFIILKDTGAIEFCDMNSAKAKYRITPLFPIPSIQGLFEKAK